MDFNMLRISLEKDNRETIVKEMVEMVLLHGEKIPEDLLNRIPENLRKRFRYFYIMIDNACKWNRSNHSSRVRKDLMKEVIEKLGKRDSMLMYMDYLRLKGTIDEEFKFRV